MANRQEKITVSIDVVGNASDFSKTLGQIQGKLNQLNVGKGLKSDLDSLIKRLLEESEQLQSVTKDGLLDKQGLKQTQSSLKTMEALWSRLISKLGDIDLDTVSLKEDAARINALNKVLDTYSKKLKEATANKESLEKKKLDQQDTTKKYKEQAKAVEDLQTKLKDLKNSYKGSKKLSKDNQLTVEELNEIEKSANNAKEALFDLYQSRKQSDETLTSLQSNARRAMTNYLKSTGTLTGSESASQKAQIRDDEIQSYVSGKNEKADTSVLNNQDLIKYIELLRERVKLEKEITKNEGLRDAPKTYDNLQKTAAALATASEKADKSKRALDALNAEVTKLKNFSTEADALREAFAAVEAEGVKLEEIGINKESITSVEDLKSCLAEAGQEAQEAAKNIVDFADTGTPPMKAMRDEVDKTTETFEKNTEAAEDLTRLKDRVKEFFSITNTVQIFRRAIQSAIDTVKELDAAMQEIAVVTEYSISDMWGELDQFTTKANELGSTITEVYEATTLFTQQGVDLETSLGMAEETLKLAAIAGMDAADATDAITAN